MYAIQSSILADVGSCSYPSAATPISRLKPLRQTRSGTSLAFNLTKRDNSLPSFLQYLRRSTLGQRPRWGLAPSPSAGLRNAVAAATPEAGSTINEILQHAQGRQELAECWGFDQLGTPLPEGLTPSVLSQSIPPEYERLDVQQLLKGVVVPLALMVSGFIWQWYMHSVIPGWQQAACWMLIGTGYFGIFTIAHDAARMVLMSGNAELQNFIGSALMAPSLYSLEAWRVHLMIHFNQTNMLEQDDAAWQPLTKNKLAKMGPLQRLCAKLTCATPLKLLGSISHWLSSWGNFDLKRYYAPMRLTMLGSWAVPFGFMALVWPTIIAVGGIGAWFDCWFMPWLVFHFWLSLVTLLQHTAPHVPFEQPGPNYDAAQAALNGTITVSMPRWLELLLNNANYHLPQHLCGAVPFYHARTATEAISKKLGPYMTRAHLNGKLLRNLIEKWQVYDEEKQTYVTLQQALDDVDASLSEDQRQERNNFSLKLPV